MILKRKNINWSTVAFGIAILLLQTPFLPDTIQFQTHSVTTLGEVVKLNAGGFHPEVKFTTQTGEQISFAGSSTYRTDIGDRLEVRYLTNEPRLARLNQIGDIWAIEIFISAFAAIFIIGGVFGMRLRANWRGSNGA
jgi:hypothetical protein